MPAKHRAPRTRTCLRAKIVATTTGPLALAALGAVSAPAAHAAPSTSSVNWDAVAQCESAGNWAASTGNGFYGGLQFTQSTWLAYGGSGSPQNASRGQQIAVANKVLAGQGLGAWPVCGSHGATTSGATPSDTTRSDTTGSTTHSATTTSSTTKSSADATSRTGRPHHAAPASTPTSTSTSTARPGKHAAATAGGGYTVASGDTLGSIATAHRVSGGWKALAAVNQDVISRPDMIIPGQHLVLPTTDSSTSSTPHTTPGTATGIPDAQVGDTGGAQVVHTATTSTGTTKATSTAASSSGAAVVDYARTFSGVPYLWGGTSRSGVDCSGLTTLVLEHFGHTPPRTSQAQYGWARHIPADQAQPGDLVFENFSGGQPGHVGIYTGNSEMIDAPTPGTVVGQHHLSSDASFARLP